MKILIVEDEVKSADYLRKGLSKSGYDVDVATTGLEGKRLAEKGSYDLVVLDINLPELDGWAVLQDIRSRDDTPVLILTARGMLHDKVKGLDLGADDYLVKPFQYPELLARVRTLLRRGGKPVVQDTLRVADIELDPGRHRAFRGNRRIDLTPNEFALLHLFMRRAGEVMTRTQIASAVWDINFDSDTNVVEVAIRRLRVKVEQDNESKLIHTIRGVGYVLEERQ